MDVWEKTAGLNYEAECNRLRDEVEKQKRENQSLCEKLKSKEEELSWYHGFEEAVRVIFVRGCYNG